MRYVDAHCHLDQYPDPKAEAGACVEAQTYTIAVTNLPSDFARTQRYVADREFVRAAAGLHPELVARFPLAIHDLLPLLQQTKYVGEIGLDYTQATPEQRILQKDVLARVMAECERLGGRVLTVHSRRAAQDVLEIVRSAKRSTVILHWFSGTTKILGQAAEAGCFFSVNPAMARSASGQSILKAIPSDRILTESDGPFVKFRGRALHPFEMRDALEEIARVRGSTTSELRSMVLQNFRRAVSLGDGRES
jgi:TatD DNase family protein